MLHNGGWIVGFMVQPVNTFGFVPGNTQPTRGDTQTLRTGRTPAVVNGDWKNKVDAKAHRLGLHLTGSNY